MLLVCSLMRNQICAGVDINDEHAGVGSEEISL